jgi:hypothetical protein
MRVAGSPTEASPVSARFRHLQGVSIHMHILKVNVLDNSTLEPPATPPDRRVSISSCQPTHATMLQRRALTQLPSHAAGHPRGTAAPAAMSPLRRPAPLPLLRHHTSPSACILRRRVAASAAGKDSGDLGDLDLDALMKKYAAPQPQQGGGKGVPAKRPSPAPTAAKREPGRDRLCWPFSSLLPSHLTSHPSSLPPTPPTPAATAQPVASPPGNGVFFLLATNVLLFVLDHVVHVPFLNALYLNHAHPQWWQWLSHAFCHANWSHLRCAAAPVCSRLSAAPWHILITLQRCNLCHLPHAPPLPPLSNAPSLFPPPPKPTRSMNLFNLCVFGKLVEETEGSFGVVFTYIACALGAAAVSVFTQPAIVRGAVSVSLGASGAIFGLFMGEGGGWVASFVGRMTIGASTRASEYKHQRANHPVIHSFIHSFIITRVSISLHAVKACQPP